jgi:hypothetical protein
VASAALLGTALLLAACSSDDRVPTRLIDGSDAIGPAFELEGASGQAVLTKARIVRVRDLRAGSLATACIRAHGGGTGSPGLVVERIGVTGETVTFRDVSGLRGCDNSAGTREGNRRWCGTVFGRLYGGRLRDPRLNIGCTTSGGGPMGFVWIEPASRARFVVVRQPGFVEVYRPVARLPVRVSSTTELSIEDASATFEISEHDERGRLVREYRVAASVAG